MEIDSTINPYRGIIEPKFNGLSAQTDETPRSGNSAYVVTLSHESLNAQDTVISEMAASGVDIDKTSPASEISTLHEDSGGSASVKYEANIRVLKMALVQQAEALSLIV